MAVLVEEVTMAKSQKSLRVKLSGSWYGAYLDSGLNAPHLKSSYIEAEITTLDKGGPWIKAWKPSALPGQVPVPASPYATPRPEPEQPKYAEPAKPNTVAPYWLPMASNVVAHAIAAGKIETPNQINIWVKGVKMAVESTSTDSDDIPF